jgi:hypothetical protein
VLANAPVPAEVQVPAGWEINETGIRRHAYGRTPAELLPQVVLITAICVRRSTEQHSVTLAWRVDGNWHQRTVPRSTIASARAIVELADFGVLANSNNASVLVAFLSDYLVANEALLPHIRESSQLGWQGGGNQPEGFLLGRQYVSVDDSRQPYQYVGADQGDEQLADGLVGRGSFRPWSKLVCTLMDYPILQFVLQASLAAPLIRIVDGQNIILDLHGASSCGKTTAAYLAASVYGDPDLESHQAYAKSWNGSAVWLERAPGVLCDLPVVLDDTKHATDPGAVSRLVFAVAAGHGRGRGSVRGIAQQISYRTVLISTGEQSLTTFGESGGQHVRVISLTSSPLGGTGVEQGRLAEKIKRVTRKFYGRAGQRFIEHLVTSQQMWPQWRARYAELSTHYVERAADNIYGRRLAPQIALIVLAGEIAWPVLGIRWEAGACVDALWSQLMSGAQQADRAIAALDLAVEHAHANPQRFFRLTADSNVPHAGWLGRWDRSIESVFDGSDTRPEPRYIGYFREHLNELLTKHGFTPKDIYKEWADRGFLLLNRDSEGKRRGYTYRTQVNGELPSLIAIRLDVWKKMQGSK